jgi:hypothetical protein
MILNPVYLIIENNQKKKSLCLFGHKYDGLDVVVLSCSGSFSLSIPLKTETLP